MASHSLLRATYLCRNMVVLDEVKCMCEVTGKNGCKVEIIGRDDIIIVGFPYVIYIYIYICKI